MHGPAPRQVRAVLDRDEAFRDAVVARFRDRAEVQSLLATWDVARVIEIVDDAGRHGDLPLVASALWAARPDGYAYGIGVVHARFAAAQREEADAEDAQAAARAQAEGEEARRRADAARMAAEAALERIERELREERGTRRSREDDAVAEASAARRAAEGVEAKLEQARGATREAEARTERATRRVQQLESDVRSLRAELDSARASAAVPADDARVIARAAEHARQVASSLDGLLRRASSAPSVAAKPAAARSKTETRRAPARRTKPNVPAGVVSDSAKGTESMLRTDGVVLLVDGYNVAKRAWPDGTLADQRERLALALAALHTRLGCSSTIVFDGDGTSAAPVLRRAGLRVLFSAAGEEADDVVVREVAALPKRVPVVVASSDAWVREHAEAEGAIVVSADTLLAVVR
jgi:predicted RNA-binding protein with PIN domain